MTETILNAGWSEDFSVGNSAIDDDHQAFFDIAALLRDVDSKKPESHVIIESVLNLLTEYAAGHFLREEKAMKKINFQYYDEHYTKHFIFREKIKEVSNKYRGGLTSATDNLHEFVFEWLTEHIAKEDMKFKMLIGESDVDDRPMAYLASEAYDIKNVDEDAPTDTDRNVKSNVNAGVKINYSKVKALIYEPSPTIRTGVRFALNDVGISTIEEAPNLLSLAKECNENEYQLIVINNDADGADAEEFIRRVRSLRTRCDPFIFIILLQSSRYETMVRAAMNSGPDCLLLVPFSPSQFISQIKVRVERRKFFIVTHDYIGYERRFALRPGHSAAPEIPIPNPIRACNTSTQPPEYEKAKKKAIETIAMARINSLVNALDYECNALMKRISEDMGSKESTLKSLVKLVNVAAELSEKVKKFQMKSPHKVDALRRRCQELMEQPEKVTLPVSRVLFDDVQKFIPDYIRLFDV